MTRHLLMTVVMAWATACTPSRLVRSKLDVLPKGKVLVGPIIEVGSRSGMAKLYTNQLETRLQQVGTKIVGAANSTSIARTAEQVATEDWDAWLYGFLYANQAELGTGFAGSTLPTVTIWLTQVVSNSPQKSVFTQRITLQGDRWIDNQGFGLERLVHELVDETVLQLQCPDPTRRGACAMLR